MGGRNIFFRSALKAGLTLVFAFQVSLCFGQQFNSDSWLSKKHGTITLIPTVGYRNTMIMNTYSLFPRWEFTMAAYLYNDDHDARTNDGYSSSLYAKYMVYENKAETGGWAIKAGTGMFPGYFDTDERTKDAFKTYWFNTPITIPLFNNVVSWDLMPGGSMTINYNQTRSTAFAFTYSSRVAWYVFGPKASLVGEMFGALGKANSVPEYKLGVRWEPSQHAVFALTYGDEIGGTHGAGVEFGVMLFTPQFACFGGCGKKK